MWIPKVTPIVSVVPVVSGVAILLAQATDPISGGAGWVGAGLLGAVLAWLLLKHLPDKDKQITNLLTMKDQQIEGMLKVKNEQLKMLVDNSADNVKRMHEENQRALDKVITHCKDEMSITNQLLQRDLNQLGEAIEELTHLIRDERYPKRRGTNFTSPSPSPQPSQKTPNSHNQNP